jgi:hypothetical protein
MQSNWLERHVCQKFHLQHNPQRHIYCHVSLIFVRQLFNQCLGHQTNIRTAQLARFASKYHITIGDPNKRSSLAMDSCEGRNCTDRLMPPFSSASSEIRTVLEATIPADESGKTTPRKSSETQNREMKRIVPEMLTEPFAAVSGQRIPFSEANKMTNPCGGQMAA